MLLSILFIIATLCGIGYVLPLSYDEAWHYLYVHDESVIQIMHDYVYPNNHIFYSILHHVIPFEPFLSVSPHVIRLLTIIVTAITIIVISKIMHVRKSLRLIAIYLFVLTFNPLLTVYSVESRGYMLGTLLLLIGLYVITLGRTYLSTVPLVLSAFTIPTFAYAFPGIWLYIAVRKHWKHALTHMVVTCSSLLLLYSPVLHTFGEHAKKWNSPGFRHFLEVSLASLFSYPDTLWGMLLTIVFLLVLLICFIRAVRNSSVSPVLWLFIASGISYIGVVFLTIKLLGYNPPFERNALFIGLFVCIYALDQLASQKHTYIRIALFMLMMLNAYFGCTHITNVIYFPSKSRDAYTPSYPLPTGEYASLKTADCLLYSAWEDEPVSLYLAHAFDTSALQLNDENVLACCSTGKTEYTIRNPNFERIIHVCKNNR
jgi:hypothetical protein